MATRKAIVLAAASVIIDEFTEEGLEVVDLVESILQTRNSDDSRTVGYVTEVVPTYCDVTFRSHFRMHKTSVEVGVYLGYIKRFIYCFMCRKGIIVNLHLGAHLLQSVIHVCLWRTTSSDSLVGRRRLV